MIAELILWAEGKPTVTLFEYKAVRQTGRDPTWNVLGVLSEKNVFFLNKAFADCKCIPDVYEPKKCIPKSRKVIWKEEDNTMFKLWQRGKEIRSDCSNKKRTHHQTELTFKMRLLLIATSLALAAVSDALETHFPLQINFLNPNTIQGGPTQRGPSKVASSSREGSLQIQTKIARGINLVFWQQLLKVAGPTAPDIMTQNISQGGFWNSISAPGSTKTIWVQVMRFSNFTKPDLVLCLYMICAHITGRETRALQRSAALKIQMELKTGEHQKAPLYKW